MLKLHFSIILLGLTGVIGKYVQIAPASIVFGRTFIAALLLFIVVKAKGLPLPSRKSFWTSFPVGLLLAVHWITFFHAIQISSIAIGLLAFSTYPVFVAILEPLFNRTRFQLLDLLFAGLAFVGLLVVLQEDAAGHAVVAGVFWGTLAGFSCALLTIWNKHLVHREDPINMGMLQNFWAAIVSIPFAPALVESSMIDWGLLICLGAFCTALAQFLFIAALKTVRAQVASIAFGLEPFYGILFATMLLQEWPTAWEMRGGLIILSAVFLSAWASQKEPAGA
jgi:drug/metabolite transporter (DMT)-like permease